MPRAGSSTRSSVSLIEDHAREVLDTLAATITADGEAYAYSYGRFFQDLYLIEGLRP